MIFKNKLLEKYVLISFFFVSDVSELLILLKSNERWEPIAQVPTKN